MKKLRVTPEQCSRVQGGLTPKTKFGSWAPQSSRYRGQGLLDTGRQILRQERTCALHRLGLCLCMGPVQLVATLSLQLETQQGTESAPGAASARAAPARTPGPRPEIGAQAAARRQTAVARDSGPLPLRLPFMLISSCSRRGPRWVPFGPSPGPAGPRSSGS